MTTGRINQGAVILTGCGGGDAGPLHAYEIQGDARCPPSSLGFTNKARAFCIYKKWFVLSNNTFCKEHDTLLLLLTRSSNTAALLRGDHKFSGHALHVKSPFYADPRLFIYISATFAKTTGQPDKHTHTHMCLFSFRT